MPEATPEPDPKEPRGWHATADAPRWQALGEGLAQRDHPLAPLARELSARVARAHTLDEAAWADLRAEERQLLGFLGTEPMDEELAGQVSALNGALTALDKQGPSP